MHSAYLLSGAGPEPRATALWLARAAVVRGRRRAAVRGVPELPPERPGARSSPLDGTGKSGPLLRHVGDHPDLLWVERGAGDTRVRIAQVRALQAELRLRTSEGGARVAVIADAEWLNQEAQNALLRLLEEPPPAHVARARDGEPGGPPRDGALALPALRVPAPAAGADPRARARPEAERALAERLAALAERRPRRRSSTGPRSTAARAPRRRSGVAQLLATASAWLRHDVRARAPRTRARAPSSRSALDAFRELQACRKALAQRNANPQMVAERALMALREALAMSGRPTTSRRRSTTRTPSRTSGTPTRTSLADTLVRWHRLRGDDAFLVSGTDEHGEKMVEAAAKAASRRPPSPSASRAIHQRTFAELGIAAEPLRAHDRARARRATCSAILQQVYDAGWIELREYEGLYCVGCERFLTERDLVDGLCRDHERAPEPRRETNYFFLMSREFDWLRGRIEANPDLIRPARYRNEVLAMLRDESGLGDLSISRPKSRLDWGVELPFDRDHVCYVWFDALITYLTGVGYPRRPALRGALGERVEHLIGKDILKPHAIFWPIMLKAIGLAPYRHLSVHGYWNVDDAQDLEEPRQHGLAARDARPLRLRGVPLLPAARDELRARRELQRGGARRARERGPREQPRQPA